MIDDIAGNCNEEMLDDKLLGQLYRRTLYLESELDSLKATLSFYKSLTRKMRKVLDKDLFSSMVYNALQPFYRKYSVDDGSFANVFAYCCINKYIDENEWYRRSFGRKKVNASNSSTASVNC